MGHRIYCSGDRLILELVGSVAGSLRDPCRGVECWHRIDWGYVSSLVSDRSAITLCDGEAGQPALMLVDKIK
ncbi:MAG: hypothetical protein ABW185_09600 [Sedimenticola sp.]